MGKRTHFHKIGRQIETVFDNQPRTVFTRADLTQILSTYRQEWEVPLGSTATKFIEFLKNDSFMVEIELESENYATQVRYGWKEPSIYEVALGIKKNSFFSHGTAVELHGLRDQPRSEIYINYEQSPKKTLRSGLIQANVDRAFSGKQRQSRLIYQYHQKSIVVINGKFTDKIGVEAIEIDNGHHLPVTSLERTLIDITVRPNYAGGTAEVLKVYQRLRGRISISDLIDLLQKIDYAYPYHQAVGFYMKQAQYPPAQLTKLRDLGTEIDFYLDYAMVDDKKYDLEWAIFYPANLL